MHNYVELIFIVAILLLVAGPIGFIRYRLYIRFIQAQESIAESIQKIAENQTKSH